MRLGLLFASIALLTTGGICARSAFAISSDADINNIAPSPVERPTTVATLYYANSKQLRVVE